MKSNQIQNILLFLFQALTFSMADGQILHLNKAIADSVQLRNWDLGWELQTILVYNEAVKSFGYTDTLIIKRKNNSFEYYYNKRLITDLSRSHLSKQGLIKIQYSHSDDLTFMVSKTQRSKKESFEIVILDSQVNKEDLVYKLTNYLNDVAIGKYIEHTKSGQNLVMGQFCQKDSTYTDTIEYFNPKNYKTITKIIRRTKFPVKTGTWKYYTPAGTPLKQEVYEPCM